MLKPHPFIKSVTSTDHRTTPIHKWPRFAWVVIESEDIVARIERGVEGYRPAKGMTPAQADQANRDFGVTPAMRESMSLGSMFGWDKPGAAPERAEGIFHKAKPYVATAEA
jgi:hypothetical protein